MSRRWTARRCGSSSGRAARARAPARARRGGPAADRRPAPRPGTRRPPHPHRPARRPEGARHAHRPVPARAGGRALLAAGRRRRSSADADVQCPKARPSYGDRPERRAQPQPRTRREQRLPLRTVRGPQEAERLCRVRGPHREAGVADGPGPDLPLRYGRVRPAYAAPAPTPAYGTGIRRPPRRPSPAGRPAPGSPGSARQPPRGGSTPAHGGPVTAAGTAAVAADSSTDSRSSPADTVTSSVTSSPFSYGLASRTARIASTSKDGGRPKTASAVPAACSRTAAERS